MSPPRLSRTPESIVWGGVACALVLTAVLSLGACSRHEEPRAPEPAFHVVLLISAGTPRPLRKALRQGLHAVESDLFAATEVHVVEAGQPLIEALRRAGEAGPDLVFCHVPGESHVVVEEAAPYEDTRFVMVPGRAVGSNVTGVVLRVDGAAYVAGRALAAAAGGRTILLVPAGSALPWSSGLESGLRAGVKAAGTTVQRVAGAPAAVTELAGGTAGAVFYAGFEPPESLLRAASEVDAPMVTIGTGGEDDCPSCLGTVVIRMDACLRRLAMERWAGTLQGRIYTYGLGSGIVDFVPGPGNLPEHVRSAIENARHDVMAGIAEVEDLEM